MSAQVERAETELRRAEAHHSDQAEAAWEDGRKARDEGHASRAYWQRKVHDVHVAAADHLAGVRRILEGAD